MCDHSRTVVCYDPCINCSPVMPTNPGARLQSDLASKHPAMSRRGGRLRTSQTRARSQRHCRNFRRSRKSNAVMVAEHTRRKETTACGFACTHASNDSSPTLRNKRVERLALRRVHPCNPEHRSCRRSHGPLHHPSDRRLQRLDDHRQAHDSLPAHLRLQEGGRDLEAPPATDENSR